MPETVEKEAEVDAKVERATKAMWVPWGVTTFEELDAAEVAQESADKMNELTWNFQDLVWNILNSSELDDKAAAVRQLSDEFADRIGVVNKAKSIIKKDLKQLNGGTVDKFIKATKKALGVDTQSPSVVIYKDQGGTYRWVGRYSNCYRDDDRPPEIVSEKSQQGFVKLVDAGLVPHPTLWIWHNKALEIGQSEWVAYDDSGFALAGGHFYDHIDEELIKDLSNLDDMAMSHGMPRWSIERDEKDNSVITQHITEEISLLPGWAAANKRTGFVILDSSIKGTNEEMMAIPKEKRQELVDWGMNPNLIDALESQNSKQATEADLADIERKEKDAEEEATEPVEESTEEIADEAQPEAEEVADEAETAEVKIDVPSFVSALEETVKAIVTVSERLGAVENELKELKQSDGEKIAKQAENTSLASLTDILKTSVIGNKETQIDGRTSLGKSAPEQAKSEPRARTGIPMIDGWLQPPAQV